MLFEDGRRTSETVSASLQGQAYQAFRCAMCEAEILVHNEEPSGSPTPPDNASRSCATSKPAGSENAEATDNDATASENPKAVESETAASVIMSKRWTPTPATRQLWRTDMELRLSVAEVGAALAEVGEVNPFEFFSRKSTSDAEQPPPASINVERKASPTAEAETNDDGGGARSSEFLSMAAASSLLMCPACATLLGDLANNLTSAIFQQISNSYSVEDSTVLNSVVINPEVVELFEGDLTPSEVFTVQECPSKSAGPTADSVPLESLSSSEVIAASETIPASESSRPPKVFTVPETHRPWNSRPAYEVMPSPEVVPGSEKFMRKKKYSPTKPSEIGKVLSPAEFVPRPASAAFAPVIGHSIGKLVGGKPDAGHAKKNKPGTHSSCGQLSLFHMKLRRLRLRCYTASIGTTSRRRCIITTTDMTAPARVARVIGGSGGARYRRSKHVGITLLKRLVRSKLRTAKLLITAARCREREFAAHCDRLATLEASVHHKSKLLLGLARVNIFNDAFHIWAQGNYAMINGLRLGKLLNDSVPWEEINGALGQAALLLDALIREFMECIQACKTLNAGLDINSLNLKFLPHYYIIPRGPCSVICQQADATVLELSGGTSGISRFFTRSRLSDALVVFVGMIKDLSKLASFLAMFVTTSDVEVPNLPELDLPYKICEDTVGGYSVKLPSDSGDHSWTQAMRLLLFDLKWVFGIWDSLYYALDKKFASPSIVD